MLIISDVVCIVIKDSIYWYWLDFILIYIFGVCVCLDSVSY